MGSRCCCFGGRHGNADGGVALVTSSSFKQHRSEFFDRQAQAVPVIQRDTGKAKALAVRSAQAVKDRANLEAAAYSITDDGDRLIVLQTVLRLVENAYKEEKYRSVNASSKVLQEKVLGRGGMPLLVAAGFQDRGEAWQLPADPGQGDTREHLQALRELLDVVQKKTTQQAVDKAAVASQLQNDGDIAGVAAVLEGIESSSFYGEAARANLDAMKTSELRRTAIDAGASEQVLENADDSDNPRETFIDIIISLQANGPDVC